jgi:hypothetical protein
LDISNIALSEGIIYRELVDKSNIDTQCEVQSRNPEQKIQSRNPEQKIQSRNRIQSRNLEYISKVDILCGIQSRYPI